MIRFLSLFLIGGRRIDEGKKIPAIYPEFQGESSFLLRLRDHHSDHDHDDDDENCPPRTPECGLFPACVKRGRGKGSQAHSPKGKNDQLRPWSVGQGQETQNINEIARGELTDNQQAPPLLASPRARLFYCLANLLLGLFDVGLNLFTALVDNFDHGFLFLYHLLHLVEKVGKFYDCLFNTLDFVVSGLDLAERGSCFATAIATEEL